MVAFQPFTQPPCVYIENIFSLSLLFSVFFAFQPFTQPPCVYIENIFSLS